MAIITKETKRTQTVFYNTSSATFLLWSSILLLTHFTFNLTQKSCHDLNMAVPSRRAKNVDDVKQVCWVNWSNRPNLKIMQIS